MIRATWTWSIAFAIFFLKRSQPLTPYLHTRKTDLLTHHFASFYRQVAFSARTRLEATNKNVSCCWNPCNLWSPEGQDRGRPSLVYNPGSSLLLHGSSRIGVSRNSAQIPEQLVLNPKGTHSQKRLCPLSLEVMPWLRHSAQCCVLCRGEGGISIFLQQNE